jgi:hypothetical protein
MARISPICKKCKIFISALKSSTYRDFMIKKIIRIQEIKISHLGTFKGLLLSFILELLHLRPKKGGVFYVVCVVTICHSRWDNTLTAATVAVTIGGGSLWLRTAKGSM